MQPLIAIVDDDKSVREALRSLFKSMGFQTALFARAQDFLESPDFSEMACLILDVMMPGMDGMQVLDHLKRDPGSGSIPVVMVTAKSEDRDVLAGYDSGADYYITKPFTARQILYALGLVLGTKEPD